MKNKNIQIIEKLEKTRRENNELKQTLKKIYASKTWKLLFLYKNIFKPLKNRKKDSYVKLVDGNFSENKILGICCESWVGVKEATINQCAKVILINSINKHNIKQIIKIIEKSNLNKISINAIPDGARLLIQSIHKKFNSSKKIYLIWHGSFTQQTIEDHIYRFESIKKELSYIHKLGFCKKNMDIIFKKIGYQAEFVPNKISSYKIADINKFGKKTKIGVLSLFLWHKNNLNQILAAALIENSQIHTLKIPEMSYLESLLEDKVVKHEFLDHDDFVNLISSMDINLYVSLTECYPMLFLESLSLGVPCLVGKTTEPIIEDKEIIKYLVIQDPENIEEIRNKIEIILNKKEYIKKIILDYAKKVNENNSKLILDFFKN